MQDRIYLIVEILHRTAGPYIWGKRDGLGGPQRLESSAQAEINNLGRLFLTGHECARSIPKIGGERVFKLGPRHSHRRECSGPNRPCDRRNPFLRLRLRLVLYRVFELYGTRFVIYTGPAQPEVFQDEVDVAVLVWNAASGL